MTWGGWSSTKICSQPVGSQSCSEFTSRSDRRTTERFFGPWWSSWYWRISPPKDLTRFSTFSPVRSSAGTYRIWRCTKRRRCCWQSLAQSSPSLSSRSSSTSRTSRCPSCRFHHSQSMRWSKRSRATLGIYTWRHSWRCSKSCPTRCCDRLCRQLWRRTRSA